VNHSLLRRALVVIAPLLLSVPALANEAAAPALMASVPAPGASSPLVLGAPPAWVVMMLGATVVSLTVLRRARKGADPRRPTRG
jgi:membrane protein implicated in regulation of membrane protease activity